MGNSAPVAANVAAPTNQYVQGSNNQIVGKYFLTDKTAIRAKVGYNTLSGSMVNRVQDAEAMYNATLGTAEDIAAATLLRVEDKLKYSKSNIMITAGYEMRRGYRRLQGVYGAEIELVELQLVKTLLMVMLSLMFIMLNIHLTLTLSLRLIRTQQAVELPEIFIQKKEVVFVLVLEDL